MKEKIIKGYEREVLIEKIRELIETANYSALLTAWYILYWNAVADREGIEE